MSNKFDDFFNEFFENNGKNNKDENSNDELDKTNQESVEQFINMINNFDNEANESLGDYLDKELGEPDQVEYFDDDDFYFEKRIWFTPTGKIVKIRMVEGPETPEEFHTYGAVSTLEDKLEVAIEEEDFEEAARLRDLINKKK